ncbi:uncharacterized protein BT62DRAFT_1051009 [Guyanagaster necrorhizus]|uniref:Zn(2)-C6 fungal-type domain-containing protein n=1 Tax=Guyanagaster necrorhizus TaxID=856835 RepID=A0A9P8AM18_9AGAR|nr:uncharacterized protein BT62DRAFT_1051009 [Guyanagaster necrorhizus MCA 3950]KAG7440269.1 hypothetical protein BT62DRAFT_1051009 [Guyanagaster necrorhizus MCA 3950]
MRDIVLEMRSQQQAYARRHLGDDHWETMVLLDIPRWYWHLSGIKKWDLAPVEVSSPCNACRASKHPCHYTRNATANECRECHLQGKTCFLGNSQGANKKRTRADSVEEDEDSDPITDSKVKRKGDNQKRRKVDSEEDKWDSNLVKRLELQLEAGERQVAGLLEENNRVKHAEELAGNM